jgi:hypothetical protein
LTVSNSPGSNTETKTGYIHVSSAGDTQLLFFPYISTNVARTAWMPALARRGQAGDLAPARRSLLGGR